MIIVERLRRCEDLVAAQSGLLARDLSQLIYQYDVSRLTAPSAAAKLRQCFTGAICHHSLGQRRSGAAIG
jgi:hypothetical protein